MNIGIIGTGYVGLVTGVCFSNVGNKVICLDIDEQKINLLNSGKTPIYEPGLQSKLKQGIKSENLKFTTNPKEAIESSDIIFIAVGTPSSDNGQTDLSYVKSAAKSIAENLNSDKIVVTKSTVPVGTTYKIKAIIDKNIKQNNLQHEVSVLSNPEFLKEGKAIKDFESPDRIVIGYDNKDALKDLKDLYRPYNLRHQKIISMDIKSAELTKYAANAMLATKISFINEVANICEKVGANINHVRKGIGSDSRIGFDFIYPGIGFGGSCFPKDLKSMQNFSNEAGHETRIINAVITVNDKQRELFADRITQFFNDKSDITIGVWGLSFKPETDDVREAPSIDIIKNILDNNIKVKAYDPIATDNFKAILSHKNLQFKENMYDVLENVDALILCSEWSEFRSPDFERMKSLMKNQIIFDGKNIFDERIVSDQGFDLFQVGVEK